jgi:hypothetical protein
MGITKAESRTLIDAAHHAKGRLCRMRVGAPAALACRPRTQHVPLTG